MVFTIPSVPPSARRPARRSHWRARLDEARACPGVWVRITEPFKRSTASQTASDIRRAPASGDRRLARHMLPNDRWETSWNNDFGNDPDPLHFYIWVRYVGPVDVARSGTVGRPVTNAARDALIRERYGAGETLVSLANRFGLSKSRIGQIVNTPPAVVRDAR